jgi:hypothetical protein
VQSLQAALGRVKDDEPAPEEVLELHLQESLRELLEVNKHFVFKWGNCYILIPSGY